MSHWNYFECGKQNPDFLSNGIPENRTTDSPSNGIPEKRDSGSPSNGIP